MEARAAPDLIATHSRLLGQRLYLFARLRFVAAAGILVGALFATYVVGIAGLDLGALAGAALFLAAYDVCIFLVVRRPARGDDPSHPRHFVGIAHVSVLLDYAVLTFCIWHVGGASSPFLAFYLLHAILAAVLLSRRAAYALAAVGYVFLAALVLAEGSGVIARHDVLGMPVDGPVVATVLFVYGLLTVVTSVLTTGIVRLLRENEQGLHAASQRVERLADLRRSFLHVVLHDLRGPVATVVTMLESVRGGVDGPLAEPQRARLERAGARLQSVLDLLRGLRVLADLETENLDGIMAPLDLATLIAGTVEDQRDAAEQRGHTVTTVLPELLPPVLGVDRLIREALANYLGNAIKYSDPGGNIRVEAIPAGRMVRVEVSDDGPGVPEALRRQLFQELVRGGKEMARGQPAGLGLGLSIVRRIAEVHHGRAGLASSAGRGSRFFLELPAGEARKTT